MRTGKEGWWEGLRLDENREGRMMRGVTVGWEQGRKDDERG